MSNDGSVRTACPYCGVGCGIVAERRNGAGVRLRGDADHAANFGRLCVKGSALDETLGLDGRLLHPEIRGRQTQWDDALDYVARGLADVAAAHGPDAVAFYVSGQLLTEEYYVANKLAKGYIGTANIDTNSRLCMSSAVAGHKRAFGADLVPGCYEDFELADLVVLVGSNAAWCHPVLYQRIADAKQTRPDLKVVVIDPRRTATTELADLHLPIRSGADVWLFNGLFTYLHRRGIVDEEFVTEHTRGLEASLRVAEASSGRLTQVADACGFGVGEIEEFYELFARRERVVTAFSQGVNQSTSGTDKVNSIINCHLLTGRIGKPGAGPFSITGQPNAMGGREVGGLANALAAHMDIENAEHRRIVKQFWKSPRITDRPGLKAVDLFDAIHAERVRAVWIMATNPIVSLPNADRVAEALRKCELVVVSDVVGTSDTARHAHVLLPALAWGEKDGTVTNSERRISRQRAFLRPPGEAKPDWWIVCEVARRMGFGEAFSYASAHEIFLEHAGLSGYRNDRSRTFDISALGRLTRHEYDALVPLQWPIVPLDGSSFAGTTRLFTDARYATADGRARFVPTPPRAPAHSADGSYPFVLNTGRIRDQWHTMTRTGRAPKLSSHTPEPFVDMHARDAMLAGVGEGALARVVTPWGSLVARVTTSGQQARGAIFAPIHWSTAFASDARVGAAVNPSVDPVSGEPELKHTPARVEPFAVDWHGFVLSRSELSIEGITWWTRIQGPHFVRYELGGRGKESDWSHWARRRLGAQCENTDWLEYHDAAAGQYRAARIVDDRLDSCVFLSPRRDLPSRVWLSSLFAKARFDEADRMALLVGQPADPLADTGPVVCACFGVGRNTIVRTIRERKFRTADEVGSWLKAGTNCGSCVPELKRLLPAAYTESG